LSGLLPAGRGFQGDTRFIAVLEGAGLTVSELPHGAGVRADRTVPGPRRGVTQDFSEFSDTFLTLAALAPLLDGPTRITGIAHTRKQETDRVAGAARELRKLGQEVLEEPDALTITPRPLRTGVEIETYGDHRFAMSFAILGSHDLHGDGRPWLSIRNPACCAKTFPNFLSCSIRCAKNLLPRDRRPFVLHHRRHRRRRGLRQVDQLEGAGGAI
jgi:3-phosphoshikimate 1-carboxyvinyltransferase